MTLPDKARREELRIHAVGISGEPRESCGIESHALLALLDAADRLEAIDPAWHPRLKISAREWARRHGALGGADAQALEGALKITERERDEARSALAALRLAYESVVRCSHEAPITVDICAQCWRNFASIYGEKP